MRKINISIDDITPHPKSSILVVRQCYKILRAVPTAKFTLFVPTAYWRTVPSPPESMCERPLRLRDFPNFCSMLSSLPSGSFEVGFHGHHHGIPGVSNNDELKSVTSSRAAEIYADMIEEVRVAGLTGVFKRILRPPAWRLSPGAFDAARGVFDILAINPGHAYEEVYCGKQRDEYWKQRVVFSDASPPIVPVPDRWESLELVFHACEWDKNYLSDHMAEYAVSLHEGAVGAFMGEMIGKV